MISALELLCRWVQLIRATGYKEASWNKGKGGRRIWREGREKRGVGVVGERPRRVMGRRIPDFPLFFLGNSLILSVSVFLVLRPHGG